ncbi:hypothetical protein FA15DRAFT_285054 [Coprinopsis marcescibilis]|uniref:Uncharacterized protein n=1 Tax=Coprinopsis marcescibilis TaxID=230819 RepID=A0A5C3LA73_COPMA|nr:hypothetical protein FA15DRAFT_285054 [Coprinopsis marcescibilis]
MSFKLADKFQELVGMINRKAETRVFSDTTRQERYRIIAKIGAESMKGKLRKRPKYSELEDQVDDLHEMLAEHKRICPMSRPLREREATPYEVYDPTFATLADQSDDDMDVDPPTEPQPQQLEAPSTPTIRRTASLATTGIVTPPPEPNSAIVHLHAISEGDQTQSVDAAPATPLQRTGSSKLNNHAAYLTPESNPRPVAATCGVSTRPEGVETTPTRNRGPSRTGSFSLTDSSSGTLTRRPSSRRFGLLEDQSNIPSALRRLAPAASLDSYMIPKSIRRRPITPVGLRCDSIPEGFDETPVRQGSPKPDPDAAPESSSAGSGYLALIRSVSEKYKRLRSTVGLQGNIIRKQDRSIRGQERMTRALVLTVQHQNEELAQRDTAIQSMEVDLVQHGEKISELQTANVRLKRRDEARVAQISQAMGIFQIPISL